MPDKINLIPVIKKKKKRNKGPFFSKCIIEFYEPGPRSTICGKKINSFSQQIFFCHWDVTFSNQKIYFEKIVEIN